MTKLVLFEENCYGCKMCEMACSFHHTGRFSLAHSSLSVRMSHDKTRVSFILDSSCDFCKNEEIPFCVNYCQYGALKGEKKENGEG